MPSFLARCLMLGYFSEPYISRPRLGGREARNSLNDGGRLDPKLSTYCAAPSRSQLYIVRRVTFIFRAASYTDPYSFPSMNTARDRVLSAPFLRGVILAAAIARVDATAFCSAVHPDLLARAMARLARATIFCSSVSFRPGRPRSFETLFSMVSADGFVKLPACPPDLTLQRLNPHERITSIQKHSASDQSPPSSITSSSNISGRSPRSNSEWTQWSTQYRRSCLQWSFACATCVASRELLFWVVFPTYRTIPVSGSASA